jgi:hypothetical protein
MTKRRTRKQPTRKKYLVNRQGDLPIRDGGPTVVNTPRAPHAAKSAGKSNTKRNLAIAGGVAASIGAFGVAATAYDNHKKAYHNKMWEDNAARNYDQVMDIVSKGGGMEWKKKGQAGMKWLPEPGHEGSHVPSLDTSSTIWHDALSDLSVTPHGESKMWHDD